MLDIPLIGEEGVRGQKPASLTIIEMIKTLDFWLFLWPCLVLIGGGIGLTTNIAQMFGSIGEELKIARAGSRRSWKRVNFNCVILICCARRRFVG